MARRGKSSAKPKAKRERAKKPEPTAEVLEEVDTGGAGIDEGIVFTTFALLAGAVYLVYSLLNDYYPNAVG